MWFYIYIFLAVAADMAGIFLAKRWADSGNNHFLVLALIAYLFVGLFFAQVLRFEGITIANIVWTASAIALGTMMGVFFFHEKIAPLA